MYKFEEAELVNVIVNINTDNKVQWSISSVYDFVLSMFEEGTLVLTPWQTFSDKFSLESNPFLDWETVIVLGESGLTLLVYHQYELDHFLFDKFS